MVKELLIGNPNDFVVKGFRDSQAAKGVYLNAAVTAVWDIRTEAGVAGGSSVASGTLSYVAGSNGEYVGGPEASDIAAVVEDTTYWANVTLIQSGVQFYANFPMVAVRRLALS